MYYLNFPLAEKSAIELLNLYLKEIPYYIFFTDLKFQENKEKLNEIHTIMKEEHLLNSNFVFIVLDNSKVIES
jgi:hypothetical protein